MFAEKPRCWLTGDFPTIFYDSWKQWIEYRIFIKNVWKKYKLIIWNIKNIEDKNNSWLLQLIYINQDGIIEIQAINICIKKDDEPVIREWLDQYFK